MKLSKLRRLPDWLGGAFVGALIALFTFVGKSLLEWRGQVHAERAATVGRLQELSILLDAYLADEKEHGVGFPQGLDDIRTRCCGTRGGREGSC